jgi:hypothetical protein
MFRETVVFAILLWGGMYGVPTRANCKTADVNQQCLGCAHEIVELEQAKTGSTIRGSVIMIGSTEGVFVEVFTRPENASPLWDIPNPAERTRAAACTVGKSGKFRLHLKPGKYELRFSRSSEWNCTYLKVEVVAGFRTKKLRVPMNIGT